MAIAYRASGTFVAANSTSSGAIGLPAGLANGDTLILPIQARGGGTVATPSGYTWAAEINATTGHRLVVFYKYVTNAAGEAAPTVTQSASGLICGRLSAFSGCDATTQLDVTPVTNKHSALATLTASSITPVSANAMAVWIFSSGDDNTLNAASQGTTAYSSDTTTGADGSLALVYELQTTAAATGTTTMTESANGPDNWNTVTLALRPSVSAAANPSYALSDGLNLAVEVAFSDAPFAPSPTWTDISSYVREIDGVINRGRSTEFSDVQPGTLTLALANASRRFDPDYAAGPYYGLLTPMKRIRVRTRYNSVNYTVFDGYVQAWPQEYEPNQNSTVTITAIDMFCLLSTWRVPATALMLDVLTDVPSAYWSCNEDLFLIDSTGNGHDVDPAFTAPFESFLTGEPDRKCHVVENAEVSDQLTLLSAPGDTIDLVRTAEVWMQCDALTDADSSITFTFRSASATIYIYATVSAETSIPRVVFELDDAANTVIGQTSAEFTILDPRDNPLHCVGVLDEGAATFTAYINGAVVGTFSTSGGTFDSGTLTGVLTVEAFGQLRAEFAHIAMYETALSATRIASHYEAGITGGAGQLPSDRLTDLATYVGLVSSGLYTTSGLSNNTYLSRASYSGSILAEMQAIIAAEQGRLFVSKDGVLTAQGRVADWDGTVAANTTSQATFGDSGSELKYMEFHSTPGTVDLLRNSISVTMQGSTVTTDNAESVALYGLRDEAITANLADPTAARNLGLSRIRRFGTPSTRIDQITIPARKAPATVYPVVLAAELGYRYTVSRRPQGGTVITKTVTVEGLQHRFSRGRWDMTFYMVPAHDIYSAHPWWKIGDATYGIIGDSAGNKVPY